MTASRSDFKYRMFYASSMEMIDYAAATGMNWVVVASCGHKGGQVEDDPPVYMPEYDKMTARRQALSEHIEWNRQRIRDLIDHAKSRGMNVIYHGYEPSVPEGFGDAYPDYFSKELKEFRERASDAEQNDGNLCVAHEHVRTMIADKIEEICRALPGIDGYMYTNNETNTTTKVWHRCDNCRDIHYPQTMKMLHDAIKEGIRRSGQDIQLFNRCWGTHETDFRYIESYKYRAQFDPPGKEWLPAYIEAYGPEHLHFKPSRDIPAYVELMKNEGTVFVYKATWADVNMHHPLNPWMGQYGGCDEVAEFSFEYCRDAPRVFFLMGREMQRRARTARDKGVKGLCAVPVCWGMHDNLPGAAHPSNWSLAEANITFYAALLDDADADLEQVAADYLERRYGRAMPRELATLLLDSEDVGVGAMNIRNVRVTGNDFHKIYSEMLRYAPMYDDWQERLRPTPDNIEAIREEKQKHVDQANDMLGRIEALREQMGEEAYEEFKLCYTNLRDRAVRFLHRHVGFLYALGMRTGDCAPTGKNIDRMHDALIQSGAEPHRPGQPGHQRLVVGATPAG